MADEVPDQDGEVCGERGGEKGRGGEREGEEIGASALTTTKGHDNSLNSTTSASAPFFPACSLTPLPSLRVPQTAEREGRARLDGGGDGRWVHGCRRQQDVNHLWPGTCARGRAQAHLRHST